MMNESTMQKYIDILTWYQKQAMKNTNAKLSTLMAFSCAKKCIKKDIPQKLIKKICPKTGEEKDACANCGEFVFLEPVDHNMTTYCMYCGQAIDWTECE